jgi:hypothetical protein
MPIVATVLATALIPAWAVAAPARPASAKANVKTKSICAFKAVAPCPINRRRIFNFWGGFTTIDVRKAVVAVEVIKFSPVRSRPAVRLLNRNTGSSVSVRILATTRIFVVRPDHSRVRVRRRTLFVTLGNYERAVMYASGKLGKRSFWNVLAPTMLATTVTLDLSDGALADLSGNWKIDSDPGSNVVLTTAPEGTRRYTGAIFDAAGVKTVTFRLTQPSTGTACIVDWFSVGATAPEQFDCGFISDAGRRLGPMAPRTPGRTAINFTRA